MDDLKERQQNEFDVIQAIYLNGVTDLRRGGKKWEPLVYSLHLDPQRGSSHPSRDQDLVPTSIKLTFRIPRNYPNVIPEITVDEAKGLTNQEISELHTELNDLAKGSIGEVMVLNMAQHVETFLFAHQKLPTGSFYDEMLIQKQMQERKIIEKELIFQEKERQAIQEEILRKQEALREEERLRREQRRIPIDPPLQENPKEKHSPVKESGFPLDPSSLPKRGLGHRRVRSGSFRRYSEDSDPSSESGDIHELEITCQKELRNFHFGEMLGVSSTGRTMHAGMDRRHGSLVAISEWRFSVSAKDKRNKSLLERRQSVDDIVKFLSSFDTEFRVLHKLSHPNIVEYIGMKTTVPPDRDSVVFHTVEEFVRGNSLASYLQDTIALDLGLLRHCALGILRGVEYLHSNNIVHRFMRDTSLFLDYKGGIKITDYGLERKIYEMMHSTNENIQLVDNFSPSIGRGAKKCDIYRVGVIILSLLNGRVVSENPPLIQPSLPAELQDFLKKCITTDEQSRWTAGQLLEHLFLKLPLEKRKFECLAGPQKIDNPPEDELEVDEGQGFMSQTVKGHSRLQTEFEVLLWLGKGGFGDVVKVRNKLDGGIYALKRIRLNPRNKLLNRKITREVKLLSRLNHENVVRYFNSWIETVLDEEDCTTSTETNTATTPTPATDAPSKKSPVVRFKESVKVNNSLGFHDNIEENAPPAVDNDWSTSYAVGAPAEAEEDESEESSEDEDLFGTSFLCLDEESDDVIFESDSNPSSSAALKTVSEFTTSDSDKNEDNKPVTTATSGTLDKPGVNPASQLPLFSKEAKFMYIQMEFCEKSTLRTAIDAGLHEDCERTWRLFREIVEGLVHIHQQGMIHRDLKPVNVFLDYNDHVKIGDFGLATSNIIHRSSGGGGDGIVIMNEKPESIRVETRRSVDFGDESMTGHVGTALYVAPELIKTGTKSTYNQKVDIYSLGIIFFEMFYRPLETNMERIRTILALRQEAIILPDDFEESLYPKQVTIARWLLNHDPSQRPTSLELLQSDHLPPLEMEEAALQEMFRHTLSNPQSKAYKFLIDSCFKQSISPAEEITYDMDTRTLRPEGLGLSLFALKQRLKHITIGVFERHGALELTTPLLTKSKLYGGVETAVQVMTQGGSIVTVPHDIRIPFARYVVSNSITNVKRFAIEKVFRERKVHGFHPRELMECAFDIVSSSKVSLMPDAEVISTVFEIIAELPWLRDKSCTIRLGHTLILEAILLHFTIDRKFHAEIKSILTNVKTEKHSKSQVQTHLVSLCLPDQFISHLFALMEIEGPLSKVSAFLKGILKRKCEAASLIKEALHELEVLETHLDAFGLKNHVVFSPSMIFGSNIYSGLNFQIMCHLKKRKNHLEMDVIAAGGRYDFLLDTFRSTLEITGLTSKGTKQYGVGVSICLDKLISGLESDDIENHRSSGNKIVEVVICCLGVGHQARESREKISLMKEFWMHGISCTCLEGPEFQTMEAAEEQSRVLGASFLVVLKDTEVNAGLRVRFIDKDRIHEKKITKVELIEHIRRFQMADGSGELYGSSSSSSLNMMSVKGREGEGHRGSTCEGSNAGSTHSLHPSSSSSSNNIPFVNITFLFPENKDKNSNWKRRQQNLMMSHIGDILSKFSKQQTVELLGIEANSALVKTLASYLQIHDNDKEQYNRSVAEILERQPRQKYLKAICDEIFDLVFDKTSPVIIIFGLLDNSFQVLL